MPETLVIIPDKEIDQQDRLSGNLAGEWGAGVAHTSGEKTETEGHQRIGFQPPAERRAIDAILAEIHAMLYPETPNTQSGPQDYSQGI